MVNNTAVSQMQVVSADSKLHSHASNVHSHAKVAAVQLAKRTGLCLATCQIWLSCSTSRSVSHVAIAVAIAVTAMRGCSKPLKIRLCSSHDM